MTRWTWADIRERIEVVAGDHWRLSRSPYGLGIRWYRLPRTWCDDELDFKCLNPEHISPPGGLPVYSDDERMDGFTFTSEDGGEYESTRFKEAFGSDRYLLGANDRDGNLFLREHGYNVRGEPFKRISKQRRALVEAEGNDTSD